MNCERCKVAIEKGDEMEYSGQILCEDCYMDALSPARACDPWKVYSAKSFEKHTGGLAITELQAQILEILKATGGIPRPGLLERLKGKITASQLERELATLRHMEKTRAEKRGNQVFVRLW